MFRRKYSASLASLIRQEQEEEGADREKRALGFPTPETKAERAEMCIEQCRGTS